MLRIGLKSLFRPWFVATLLAVVCVVAGDIWGSRGHRPGSGPCHPQTGSFDDDFDSQCGLNCEHD